jgi:predicted nucleic acid-binding protein
MSFVARCGLDIVGKLPIKLVAPSQVAEEIESGSRLGHPVTRPGWVDVQPLAGPFARVAVATLDAGEAAVTRATIVCAGPAARANGIIGGWRAG